LKPGYLYKIGDFGWMKNDILDVVKLNSHPMREHNARLFPTFLT